MIHYRVVPYLVKALVELPKLDLSFVKLSESIEKW
jgi:hypothetical protein